MLLRKQLPAFQTVTAGKKNSCYIPDGVKVHKIVLEVGDANGLDIPSGNLIGDIDVWTASGIQRNSSAQKLIQVNSIRGPEYALATSGTPGQAGFRSYPTIHFATPWDSKNRDGLAWNCPPGTGLRIDVGIVAGVATPVLQGWYYYSPTDGPLALIEKWFSSPLQISGDANEHSKLPGVKEFLQSLHFFPTAAGIYVDELTIKRGPGSVLWDAITHLQNQVSMKQNDLQPDTVAAPRYDAMFDEEDPQDSGLPVPNDQTYTFKTSYSASAAGTMDIVAVVLGKPE